MSEYVVLIARRRLCGCIVGAHAIVKESRGPAIFAKLRDWLQRGYQVHAVDCAVEIGGSCDACKDAQRLAEYINPNYGAYLAATSQTPGAGELARRVRTETATADERAAFICAMGRDIAKETLQDLMELFDDIAVRIEALQADEYNVFAHRAPPSSSMGRDVAIAELQEPEGEDDAKGKRRLKL